MSKSNNPGADWCQKECPSLVAYNRAYLARKGKGLMRAIVLTGEPESIELVVRNERDVLAPAAVSYTESGSDDITIADDTVQFFHTYDGKNCNRMDVSNIRSWMDDLNDLVMLDGFKEGARAVGVLESDVKSDGLEGFCNNILLAHFANHPEDTMFYTNDLAWYKPSTDNNAKGDTAPFASQKQKPKQPGAFSSVMAFENKKKPAPGQDSVKVQSEQEPTDTNAAAIDAPKEHPSPSSRDQNVENEGLAGRVNLEPISKQEDPEEPKADVQEKDAAAADLAALMAKINAPVKEDAREPEPDKSEDPKEALSDDDLSDFRNLMNKVKSAPEKDGTEEPVQKQESGAETEPEGIMDSLVKKKEEYSIPKDIPGAIQVNPEDLVEKDRDGDEGSADEDELESAGTDNKPQETVPGRNESEEDPLAGLVETPDSQSSGDKTNKNPEDTLDAYPDGEKEKDVVPVEDAKPKTSPKVIIVRDRRLTETETEANQELLTQIREVYKELKTFITTSTAPGKYTMVLNVVNKCLSRNQYDKQLSENYLKITPDRTTSLYRKLLEVDKATQEFNIAYTHRLRNLTCKSCGKTWEEDVTFAPAGTNMFSCRACGADNFFEFD